MKFLVVVSSVVSVILARPEYYDGGQYPYQGSAAPIGHDGRVIDTPEVAYAKAAHLQAFADIAARIPYGGPAQDYEGNGQASAYAHPYAAGNYGYSKPTQFSSRIYHVPHAGYQGPPAPLNHEGRVIDTPEVAKAKAAHFAALHHAGSLGAYNAHVHDPSPKFAYSAPAVPVHHNYAAPIYAPSQYHGPSAPLAHDGRVIDTPEVAQAKAAHFAAIAKATHGPYGAYEEEEKEGVEEEKEKGVEEEKEKEEENEEVEEEREKEEENEEVEEEKEKEEVEEEKEEENEEVEEDEEK